MFIPLTDKLLIINLLCKINFKRFNLLFLVNTFNSLYNSPYVLFIRFPQCNSVLLLVWKIFSIKHFGYCVLIVMRMHTLYVRVKYVGVQTFSLCG